MTRIALFLALVLVVTGCGHKMSEGEVSLPGHSAFDGILARQSVIDRVKQIELDLRGDVYKSIGEGTVRPQHWNDSRRTREFEFADELLHEFQPSLKQMSVSDLISAMKLYPVFSGDSPRGVAYWLCGEGNQMIIDEIELRPVYRLGPLKLLTRDNRFEVFLNESYSANLDILCQEILNKKGVVVPDR